MGEEIERLKAELRSKEAQINELQKKLQCLGVPAIVTDVSRPIPTQSTDQLTNSEIARYSRQLILPEIGVKGQKLLKSSSVLIVGAGGLGCPAAIYLAAAGVGTIGLVDYDEADLSNLHRQILHTEGRVGVPKSASASYACEQLNSAVNCVPYHLALDSSNALNLIKQYDVILDATDNVATRYLLNDACVLAEKPLVSGSALRFEGQLTVYNYNSGPCYRCLFPKPPPPETVTNCSDGGVLGVIPGIIGSLQALETVKLVTGISTVLTQKLLLFDGLEGVFRTIKLRPKQKTCAVCGDSPSITRLIDYEQFCGAKATDKSKDVSVLSEDERVSVTEYHKLVTSNTPHILLDVRLPVELDICKLDNCINIPMSKLEKEAEETLNSKVTSTHGDQPVSVYVLCRRGNDSQKAVQLLKEKLQNKSMIFKDIKGGLTAWAKQIDQTFPTY